MENIVNTEVNYAGFWNRFAASVLDMVVIIFLASSMRWVLMDYIEVYVQTDLFDIHDYDRKRVLSFIIWSVTMIFVRWSYFAGMESSPTQATVGKMICGLYVADARKGTRVSFAKATGRHFAKILSSILYIGFIMAAFTDRKQGLHDSMSECIVLSK